jgi:hypothetical protein
MRYGRSKGRTRDSKTSRNVESRQPRPARVLILCEGEKTEPHYFQAILREFGLTNVVLIEGAAGDPLTLVQEAKSRTAFETVWCVFDRDSFPADRFDNAVQMCDGKRLHAIWSNEAFELWYVLHFQYLNTGTSVSDGNARTYYQSRLKDLLGTYKKNAPDMWEHLRESLPTAQQNAKRLLSLYEPDTPPHKRLPATYVGVLVQELQNYKDFQ